MLTVAAAPFRIPNALTTGAGMRSWGWLISKLPRELSHHLISISCTTLPSQLNRLVVLPLGLGAPVLVRRDLNKTAISVCNEYRGALKHHSPESRQRHRSRYENLKTRRQRMSIQLPIRRKQSSPYHGDGCAEGSLVVVQELKAGELADLTAIGAQGPLSKGRGAKSNRQRTAGCGVGSSGRMCQGGHGAHRGTGGNRVHCDNVHSCTT